MSFKDWSAVVGLNAHKHACNSSDYYICIECMCIHKDVQKAFELKLVVGMCVYTEWILCFALLAEYICTFTGNKEQIWQFSFPLTGPWNSCVSTPPEAQPIPMLMNIF